MQVNYVLHAPATLSLGKETPLSIEFEFHWAHRPVLEAMRKENYHASQWNRTSVPGLSRLHSTSSKWSKS
jgi:hypothetical protein